ncbi:MMPL family transporter [Candidatus Woesearchaeota archaeon]|nr:MMPL family transporter [Candidatus Woesearchaeota archaeon]
MDLERLGEGLARRQIRRKALFMGLLAVLLVATVPGIPLLMGNVEPSLEKILPQEVEEVRLMNEMRGKFGADMSYLLVHAERPAVDVRDHEVVEYVGLLSERLRTNEYILEVQSLADVVKEVNGGVIPPSDREVEELIALHPQTPRYLNHDHSLSVIHLRTDTGADSGLIDRVVEDTERAIDATQPSNPGVRVEMTGFNTIDKATFEVIIDDFKLITGLSFLLMAVFLFLYFGSARKVVSSLSVIMASLLITLGLTGYLGVTITVVTMVAAAMIMALGISYGINVTYDYYRLRRSLGRDKALVSLNRGLIRALVGSSLTTSAGFLALLFGVIPAMKNLGVVLAMGISVTLLVSVLFLPVILLLTDKKKKVIST